MKKMLITGALGQIGTELSEALSQKFGSEWLVISDMKDHVSDSWTYEKLDVTDSKRLQGVIEKHEIGVVYHLAAILSATGEANPDLLWRVNMEGLKNVLDLARTHGFQVFVPSSIAAFGPETPGDHTPQVTIQRPTTMYGVSKVAGELLCDYYHTRYGVDVRGLRFPGIISYKTLPGGGTTDYAVHIYHDALKQGAYTSYIARGTFMDMLYMPDAIEAILQLMAAEASQLRHRNAYNITAMSFDPEMLGDAIRDELGSFDLSYDVDPVRQAIAQSWPNSLDDSAARADWGWHPKYTLKNMTRHMIQALREQDAKGGQA